MRAINLLINTTVLVFSLIFFQSEINAQTNSKYWKNYHLFLGLSAGPSQTKLLTQINGDWSQIEASRENSICFTFDGGYFFNKYFGISTGIGINTFNTVLSLSEYFNSIDTLDSEGEHYERLIEGNDIREIQKIKYLDLPVMVILNYPYSRIIGLYLQTGVSLLLPISTSYSSSGIFSYSGYYPAYNVTLTDLPYEGFASNVQTDSQGKLKIKTISSQANVIGGFYFYPDKQFQISIGFFYKRMLTNNFDYSTETTSQLSTYEGQIRSLMEYSSKVSARSVGVLISIRYFLK